VGPLPRDRRRRGRRRDPQRAALSRFISLEGVDGAGKSTQARLLAEALAARGIDVLLTREPGGTRVGERLRALLLDPGEAPLAPATEVLLFAAARAQLVAEVIRPTLESGRWVIADRFLDSSLAYQGAARGHGVDAVLGANALAVDGCLPDLTLVLDLPVGEALTRRAGGPADRIETEGAALQEAVAEGYRELAARFPERVRLVPAGDEPGRVAARILTLVEGLPA
jgi:dTMP kinase